MAKVPKGTKWRRNIAEKFNRLSRAHERYRQTTDGRATAYTQREREFTSAKNYVRFGRVWRGNGTELFLQHRD